MKHCIPEIYRVLRKKGILPQAFKMQKVERQYAFDQEGVAQGTSEFLEITYPYAQPELRGTISD